MWVERGGEWAGRGWNEEESGQGVGGTRRVGSDARFLKDADRGRPGLHQGERHARTSSISTLPDPSVSRSLNNFLIRVPEPGFLFNHDSRTSHRSVLSFSSSPLVLSSSSSLSSLDDARVQWEPS